ncbi:MAG: tyrosine-type recombinase/integrase [Parvularculaceae bacterium]|nr:tyrosine-type recombinase/integrase [Parvularculaceae bacterium]
MLYGCWKFEGSMPAKLTKRVAEGAKMKTRDAFLWDTEIAGFGIKVTPAGRRVYILQARLEGRKRRFTIGRHGSPWTVDEARKEAVRLLATLCDGVDPHQAEQAETIRIDQLCDLYMEEGSSRKKQSTIETDRSLIRRHIKPLIERRLVSSLTKADIELFITRITSGHTKADIRTRPRGRAIVKGGKGTANRTRNTLGSICTFAVDRQFLASNPVLGVKDFKLPQRERFLSMAEFARLGQTLDEAERDGANAVAVAVIRMLMLTGARKSEILTLQWEWVDLERGAIRLPDSKTGAKAIMLGSNAVSILKDQPRTSSPYVFPTTSGVGHFVGLQQVWSGIRKRAELDNLRLHDLRHPFASVAAASGSSLFLIAKLLGHSQI